MPATRISALRVGTVRPVTVERPPDRRRAAAAVTQTRRRPASCVTRMETPAQPKRPPASGLSCSLTRRVGDRTQASDSDSLVLRRRRDDDSDDAAAALSPPPVDCLSGRSPPRAIRAVVSLTQGGRGPFKLPFRPHTVTRTRNWRLLAQPTRRIGWPGGGPGSPRPRVRPRRCTPVLAARAGSSASGPGRYPHPTPHTGASSSRDSDSGRSRPWSWGEAVTVGRAASPPCYWGVLLRVDARTYSRTMRAHQPDAVTCRDPPHPHAPPRPLGRPESGPGGGSRAELGGEVGRVMDRLPVGHNRLGLPRPALAA